MVTPGDIECRISSIQVVSDIQANILLNLDIENVAETQKMALIGRSAKSRLAMNNRLAKVYDFEDFESLLEDPKCAKCGDTAANRCSGCKNEWYCR